MAEVAALLARRLPDGWFSGPPEVSADGEEILVIGPLADGGEDPLSRARRFREETREPRVLLAAELLDAAAEAGEPTWRLPLPPEYHKEIESDVADLKNVGDRYGGALVAGLFLQEFVDDRPWAHLDIAGPARAESEDGYLGKGSTGVAVRTLLSWLERRGRA